MYPAKILGPLKVIRYINYGCVMYGTDMDSEMIDDKIYCSFIELSNGRIVSVLTFCYLQPNGSFGDCDVQILPTSIYVFGEDFNVWWEDSFSYDDLERIQADLDQEEFITANEFYLDIIEPNLDVVTGVISLE